MTSSPSVEGSIFSNLAPEEAEKDQSAIENKITATSPSFEDPTLMQTASEKVNKKILMSNDSYHHQIFFGSGRLPSSSSMNTEPATPASLASEYSEADFLSPTGLANSGKKLWSDSSSWIASRLAYQSQSSSSAHSSMDRSNFISSSSNTNSFSTSANFDRDPTAVERSNLLNITKLVIKELIEWSIRHGRSLESDHPPLQHFFIVLEHAMRHGLKPKKGLLGPKKELWDVLQMVERCTVEAQDITASIRDLPTVSTHLGRARAWLRLALMQKKLADYFKILVESRDEILKEFYEPIALMMSDEAPVLSGLLVGLNVIDCNFCLKEEDLDSQQGVIDFSLYLRSSRSSESAEDDAEPSNMDSVLDQKNYIEELNRHLNATVTNLQARVETLTTTNALMKENLAISKNTILSLQDENRSLKLRLDHYTAGGDTPDSVRQQQTKVMNSRGSPCTSDTEAEAAAKKILEESAALFNVPASPDETLSVTDLSKKLHDERMRRADLEKDLKSQTSQKAEMEEAMKLMEKDIHEKQDTVITLRRQLEDIKTINLEMYRKLQECEKTLKYKSELVTKLEAKATMLGDTITKLDEKLTASESELKSAQETMRNLGLEIADRELKVSTLEGDLRIEREWRQSLQETIVKDKEKISELNMDIQRLQLISADLDEAQKEIFHLRKTCREQEETLTDMGVVLSASKLREDDLRESSKSFAHWADDKEVSNCKNCDKEFSLTRRKHHCRKCGEIFCKMCSDNVMPLPSSAKPVRVCDSCYTNLLQRCSAPNLRPT